MANPEGLSRRDFLKLASAAGAGLLLSGGISLEAQSQEALLMPEKARQLGKEINVWTLSNGVNMASAFPEIKNAADLLEGKLDPRHSFPFLSVPMALTTGNQNFSSFTVNTDFDNVSQRKIIVDTDDGRQYTLPFLRKNLVGSITLTPEVYQSSLRLAVAAKEASQIVDMFQYCQVVVSLLEKQGGHFRLENPDNLPTSREEMVVSIAYAQCHSKVSHEAAKWLYDFIDCGSHIRVGGIAFANWYLEQARRGVEPVGIEVDAGHNIAGFLQEKGYIQQKNGMFVWTKGKAPEIQSQELMDLFNEYTGRS